VARYTEGIELDPTEHTLFSNRSMANLSLGNYEAAAADGIKCVELNPMFMKGYHRAGSAYMKLERYEDAAKIVQKGLVLHKADAALMSLLEEARAAEASAAVRAKRSMGRAELLKTEGNELFKAARFEDAIHKYTEALNACDSMESPVALAILNNRAACHQQLSAFGRVVDDATMVLEVEPENLKALLRRALAFEGLEKYRSALSDVRQVLAIDPTHPIANQLQHRVGSIIRTLKEERPTV
jgi:stress-induced-phosphoprotein 1